MAGLLDGLFNGSPEQQGLMAAYSQLMQDSGPSLQPRGLYQNFGRSLSAGQEATQQARQQQQIGQMRGLQIRGAENDLAATDMARQRAVELQNLTKSWEVLRKTKQQPQQAAQAPQDRSGAAMFQGLINGQAPSMSAPGEQMQQPMGASSGATSAFDPAAEAQERFQYAQYLRENGRPDAAAAEYEAALKMMPEFDTTPRTGNDASGKPFQYLVGKRGEKKVLDGVLPREELKLASLGNRDEAYNPYELKVGQTFKRGLSPEGAASNALGYANLDLSKQRLNFDKESRVAADARAERASPMNKPMPVGALKMQEDGLEKLTTATGINSQLSTIRGQIKDGALSFGPVTNLINQGLNASGASTEGSRNYANFKVTLEKLRNDSLRLNTGVQTDGDAQREWNALFQNINDTKWVAQRLESIEGINARGAELQKLKVDAVRGNYGRDPLDYSRYELAGSASPKPAQEPKPAKPAAPAGGGQSMDKLPPASQHEGRRAKADNGMIFVARGGKWVRE